MPVPCHQCGQPIDILHRPTARPTLHFHGRCYSEFQAAQDKPATADQHPEEEPPYPGRHTDEDHSNTELP